MDQSVFKLGYRPNILTVTFKYIILHTSIHTIAGDSSLKLGTYFSYNGYMLYLETDQFGMYTYARPP